MGLVGAVPAIGLKDWVAIALSLLAVCVSCVTLGITFRREARDRLSFRNQYFATIRTWAEAAVETMSDAIVLCEYDPRQLEKGEFYDRRQKIRARLWSLIDRGRFFFPNYDPKNTPKIGQDKPTAYQGYRHEVLDQLVFSVRVVKILSYVDQAGEYENKGGRIVAYSNWDRRDELVRYQRQFVSYIQEVLAPQKVDREMRALMGLQNERIIKGRAPTTPGTPLVR